MHYKSSYITIDNSLKYCLLTTISLLLFGNLTFSQNNSIIFTIEYNRLFYPFISYPDHENNRSYELGGQVSYFFSSKVAFKTGIQYESKNFLIDYEGGGSIIKKEYFNLDYLFFPLKIEFDLIESKPKMLSINAGFELGYLLSGSRFIEYQTGASGESNSGYYFNKSVNNFTFGISFRYFFSPNFYFGIQPSVRSNLTNMQGISGDSGQGTRFSWGIQLAFGYKLSLA